MKYLVVDTESGSRKPNSTLLSAAFIVVDDKHSAIDSLHIILNDKYTILDTLHLLLKPEDDCLYVVDAQGMAVNKIILTEHDKVAITYKGAKPLLYNFLKKHGGVERLVPVGHGVKGDIRRICENLISEGSWEQFCTYHFIDTSVVLQFLRACGIMPLDMDGSVSSLASYFGIAIDGELHTAKYDAELTIRVLQKMIELVKII